MCAQDGLIVIKCPVSVGIDVDQPAMTPVTPAGTASGISQAFADHDIPVTLDGLRAGIGQSAGHGIHTRGNPIGG